MIGVHDRASCLWNYIFINSGINFNEPDSNAPPTSNGFSGSVGSRSGEEPFEPIVRLNASGGITWQTFITYYLNGNAMESSDNLNSYGGDFTPTQLEPGTWQFVASRSGISNSGFVSLSKTLDIKQGVFCIVGRRTTI